MVGVKFDALKDEMERMYFKRLPTSFKLAPEKVDQLREVARRLLVEPEEFQRLLRDSRCGTFGGRYLDLASLRNVVTSMPKFYQLVFQLHLHRNLSQKYHPAVSMGP
jgi:hypothetical protein